MTPTLTPYIQEFGKAKPGGKHSFNFNRVFYDNLYSRHQTYIFVGPPGLEPGTNRL